MGFGQKPLTHPLLVEVIETEFIPVAVANNKPGKNAGTMKRFREPAWNNPVMRFVDAAGKDILPRRDRIWKAGAVASRLIEAIEAANRPVPEYLRVAAAELNARRPQRATFGMASFWDGEARLGAVNGILSTRAGWIDELEVVEVLFDEETISYGDLIRESLKHNCARAVFAHSEEQLRQAKEAAPGKAQLLDGAARDASWFDRKYELKKTPYQYLPLTPLQASRANAALRLGTDATRFLSARQRAMAEEIAAVLEADRNAISYLKPPETDLWALSAYEDRLRSKLEVLQKENPGKRKKRK